MNLRLMSLGLFFVCSSLLAQTKARTLKSSEFLDFATSQIDAELTEIIFDNDLAWDKKLRIIQTSQDETIRMAYYIMTPDYSSSYLLRELVQTVKKQNSRARILLDLLTNYKNLEFYKAIEQESHGRIEFRFFNRPSETLIKSALYLTQECPDAILAEEVFSKNCRKQKLSKVQKQLSLLSSTERLGYANAYSSLFLSGFLSRTPQIMSQAMVAGTQVDFADIKKAFEKSNTAGSETAQSKEQVEALKKLIRLYWNAKVHGDVTSHLELLLASVFYSDQLLPLVNLTENLLPFGLGTESHEAKEWEHLTDYLHHKLLMAGDRAMILGGRNIEDSYHVRKNPLAQNKYLFLDTDSYAEFTTREQRLTAQEVAKSYDRLWFDSNRVVGLSEILRIAPLDWVEFYAEANAHCLSQNTPKADVSLCQSEYMVENRATTSLERIQKHRVKLYENAARFEEEYLFNREIYQTPEPDEEFPEKLTLLKQENPGFSMYYVENLPYKNTSANWGQSGPLKHNSLERSFGVDSKNLPASSKFIHELWIRGIEKTCALSAQDNKERHIIFHNAYLLLPSPLAQAISKGILGTWNCSNVKLSFVTNSIQTTDLNVINPLTRTQMHALVTTLVFQKHPSRSFKDVRFYEYKNAGRGGDLSLHSKVTVMGDDILVGSANADPRSMILDTNNGFYFSDVPGLAGAYTYFFEKAMYHARYNSRNSDNKLNDLTESYFGYVVGTSPKSKTEMAKSVFLSKEQILQDQMVVLLSEIEKKWNISESNSPKLFGHFKKQYLNLMNSSYELMLLTFSDIPKPWDRKIDPGYAWSKNWIYDALDLPTWGFDSYHEKGLRAQMLYYRLNAKDAGERFDRLFELF